MTDEEINELRNLRAAEENRILNGGDDGHDSKTIPPAGKNKIAASKEGMGG